MYKKARESFTMQDIESILNKFEVYSNERLNKKDYLVFPTVCHHSLSDKASYKLYYYNDTKMFKCYTHCDEAFDIFDLIKRIYENNYYSISMTQAYKIATGQDVEKKEDNKFKIDFSYNSYKKTNKNDNVKKEIEV
jgi:predicted ribosome-associated RNA-binding protein Tma20